MTQDKTGLVDGDIVNLNTAAEQNDHYERAVGAGS